MHIKHSHTACLGSPLSQGIPLTQQHQHVVTLCYAHCIQITQDIGTRNLPLHVGVLYQWVEAGTASQGAHTTGGKGVTIVTIEDSHAYSVPATTFCNLYSMNPEWKCETEWMQSQLHDCILRIDHLQNQVTDVNYHTTTHDYRHCMASALLPNSSETSIYLLCLYHLFHMLGTEQKKVVLVTRLSLRSNGA